jgi:hypothetical protein
VSDQPTTYTSNTLTPQAQQMQGLINSITAMPAGQVPSQAVAQPVQQQAVSTLTGMENNQQANQQNVQNTLNQQTISPLMQQYSNLIPAFQMYQADQNLAQKYMNNMNPNIYANQGVMSSAMSNPANVLGIQDPYLGSAASIINSIVPPSTGGFAGYSDPQSAIAASNVPISSVPQMLNLVQNAITGQTTRNNAAMSGYEGNYSNTMSGLQTLIGYLSNQQTANKDASGNTIGSIQQAGATFDDIINQVQQAKGGQATENDIWNYINEHDSALRAQGVNVDELWALHKQLAQKVGTGGAISGGKTATSFQSKKIGSGTDAVTVNFNPKTGKYYDPNTGKQYMVSDPVMKSAENVMANIDQIWSSWSTLPEWEKHIPDSLITAAPFLSPTRASLNTQFYYGLEGDLRKLVIGGRITQQEIQWIKNAIIPTYADSDVSAKAKVDAVKRAIANKLANPNIDLTQTKLPGQGTKNTVKVGAYTVQY